MLCICEMCANFWEPAGTAYDHCPFSGSQFPYLQNGGSNKASGALVSSGEGPSGSAVWKCQVSVCESRLPIASSILSFLVTRIPVIVGYLLSSHKTAVSLSHLL